MSSGLRLLGRTLVAAFFAVATSAALLRQTAGAATVTVASGSVAGLSSGGVDAYLGIPYAAAPIAARRFAPPAPAPHWTGTRDATKYGASCPQEASELMRHGFGPFTPEYLEGGQLDEDCLFLNVWTPVHEAKAKLPVLMWIHGGGFMAGSGAVPIYDGANLAKDGIVVVTINYRLGALGFFAAPVLGENSGNYGIMDMVAALKWIKRNIEAFGGDPSRVTIAGQSAGSAAVHALVASPSAKGLFVGAIAESGSGLMPPAQEEAKGEQAGVAFMQAHNVTTLEELRALPATDFVQTMAPPKAGVPAMPHVQFTPVFDGKYISSDPTLGSDVPYVTGLNGDESSAANPHYGSSTPDALRADAEKTYGADSGKLLALYPAPSDAIAGEVSKQIKRDGAAVNTWLWARNRAKTKHSPVYMYLFTHVEPGPDAARYGAFHTSEVPYVFGTLDKTPQRGFTATDRTVSNTVMAYWSNFVRTGNPNAAGLANWPALDSQSPQILLIGDSIAATPLLDADKRAFFSSEINKGVHASLF